MTGLTDHLASGATTLCRAWAVTRGDGAVMGFTDHDRDLAFDGIAFRADSGLTASALDQTTGLAVDNGEALGVLTHDAIREADIAAGAYDGAAVTAWLVNWQDVAQRAVLFAGTIGEITRSGPAFRAELRGLAEALARPRGRVYQSGCGAVLGDAECGVDLTVPGYRLEGAVLAAEGGDRLRLANTGGHDAGWFARGRLTVTGGTAKGRSALVKSDDVSGGERALGLWEALDLAPGDTVAVTAGCDRRADTCRAKFSNLINFRGFPHIPGDDWLMSYPRRAGTNDGGTLR